MTSKYPYVIRPISDSSEVQKEARKLREQATVIAISEANATTEALEAVAEPDRIVNIGFEEITDSLISVFCPANVTNPSKCLNFFMSKNMKKKSSSGPCIVKIVEEMVESRVDVPFSTYVSYMNIIFDLTPFLRLTIVYCILFISLS